MQLQSVMRFTQTQKEILTRVFFCEYCDIFKNIFWRKFVNSCFWMIRTKFFIHLFQDCKIGVLINIFQRLQENTYATMPFLINIVADLQLKPIFIQKDVPSQVFYWKLFEILNNGLLYTFF